MVRDRQTDKHDFRVYNIDILQLLLSYKANVSRYDVVMRILLVFIPLVELAAAAPGNINFET